MTYSKPELFATETALDAIRGGKQPVLGADSDQSILYTEPAAYEVDE